jgi:hypothetical protein
MKNTYKLCFQQLFSKFISLFSTEYIRMSKTKTKSKSPSIVEIKPMTKFEYPRGVLKALRTGKKDQVVAETIWRYQRKGELEDKTLIKLNRILEKQISAQKGNDVLIRRIKAVLNKGDKKQVLNLILDIEVKKAVVKGKIEFQEPVEMWKEKRLEDLEALNIKQINSLLKKYEHSEIKTKEEKKDAIQLIIDSEEEIREKIEGKDLPYEEAVDFEYKTVPVPDVELAKLLDLPLREEKLVPVTKRYYVIPGIEPMDTDEVIRLKKVGDMLLGGQKLTEGDVKALSPSDEYKLVLKDMDIEKLADLFFKSDIPIEEGPISDYIEALLNYADIKDPRHAINELEQDIATLKGETKRKKIARREVRYEEEDEAGSEGSEDNDESKGGSEDEEDEDDKGDEADSEEEEGEGAGEYTDKLQELEAKLKILEAAFKEDMKNYEKDVEDAQKKIKSLEKNLKKHKLSVKKVRNALIKGLLQKEEDMLAKRYHSSEDEEEKDEKYKNPYNKKYPKFTRVKFKSKEGEVLKGTVMGFAPQGVDISVVTGERGESKSYKVAYKNPSLKRIKKEKAVVEPKYMEFEDTISLEDLYEEPVSRVLRTLIKDLYVNILTEEKEEKKDEEKDEEQFQGRSQGRFIKPMTWSQFWSARFDRRQFNIYRKNLDMNEDFLMDKAKEIFATERDEDKLLTEIVGMVGEFTDQTSASDFEYALKDKETLTPLEAYLLKNIGAQEETENIKGNDLMVLIAKTVKDYLQHIPRNIDQIFRSLKNFYIHHSFLKYYKNKNQEKAIARFLKKHKDELKKEYENYKKAYGSDETAKKVETAPVDNKTKAHVERFEEIAYKTSGGSVAAYLQKIIMPYLFLEGPLSDKAHVFKAKIKNGSYEFSSLNSATLAHYLPEFAVPNINDDEAFELANSIIEDILETEMDRILDLYLSVLNPSKRRINKKDIEKSIYIAAPLKALTKDVVNVCKTQTGTGQRPVIKNGKYIYKMVGKGANKKKVQLMEDIPNGDLVMCYDKKEKNFKCFDSQEVLRDIKRRRNKTVLSQTGYIYPLEFIRKIKKRAENIEIPGEEIEEVVEVKPARKMGQAPVLVKKRGKRVPVHIPALRRVKKDDFKEIKQILLVGDQFDLITLFSTTLDFEGVDGPMEIPITTNLRSKKPNVVVLGFNVNAKDTESIIEDLEEKYSSLGKTVKSKADIYLVGAGPANKKDRTLINAEIKGSEDLKDVKRVFYADSFDEEDAIDTLVNVVIDVEGPGVVAQRETVAEEWAYKAATPPLERKLRRKARKEREAREKDREEAEKEGAKKLRRKARKEKKQREVSLDSVEPEEDDEPEFREQVYTSPPSYGQKAVFTAAEKKRWRKMMEREMKKPAMPTKEDIILQNMKKRAAAKQEDPLLRAALIGDVFETKKLLPTADDYDVVEVYRIIQEAGGSKDILRILRNDSRVKKAAFDGDLEILKYLVEKSDEISFRPVAMYNAAKQHEASEDVLQELRKYPEVKKMLKEKFDAKMSRERKRGKV